MLALAALIASATVARAQYTCGTLNDQDNAHSFSTPLLNKDHRTVFSGDIQYGCNHSSGGVTYNQNLSYIFDYSENATAGMKVLGPLGNDTFRLDMSASLSLQTRPPLAIIPLARFRIAPAPVSPRHTHTKVAATAPSSGEGGRRVNSGFEACDCCGRRRLFGSRALRT
jgi:hypothetical protein